MEQAAQLEAIKRYTIQKLGSDSTGHGLDHIMRVVRMTKKLMHDQPYRARARSSRMPTGWMVWAASASLGPSITVAATANASMTR